MGYAVESNQSQRQLLLNRFKRLSFKRSSLVLGVWGEAGIGKTHTAEQLLTELTFHSISVHAAINLSDCLINLPLPTKLPAFTTHIVEALERQEHVEPSKILDAISTVLTGLSPIVLHFEDIHEVSPVQLEQIVQLAERLKHCKGVGLLVTSRYLPPSNFEALRLEPLEASTMKLLLESEFRAELPQAALTWLYQRTQGNPLFSLEFSKLLAKRGYLWNDGQKWQWREPETKLLPVTIETLIEQALFLVNQEPFVPQALNAKALIPRASDSEFWALTAGLSQTELQKARVTLEKSGMLVNDELSHPLFQELTMAAMPSTMRQSIARRTLAALSENPLSAIEYLGMADLPQNQQQLIFQNAILMAEQTNNVPLAADLTLQSLVLYCPETQAILARSMALSVKPFDLLKAASLYAQITNLTLEDQYQWACILAQVGQFSKAKALLAQIPQLDQKQLPWFEHQVMIHGFAEDAAGAVHIWEQTSELHHSHNVACLLMVATSLTTLSYFAKASNLLEQILAIATQPTDIADALMARGRINSYLGKEHQDFTDALKLYEQQNNQQGIAMVLYRLGVENYYSGSPRMAAKQCQAAMQIFEQTGSQHYWTCAILTFAIFTELAQYQEAERNLLETEAYYARNAATGLHVEVCNHLSYLYRGWDIAYAPMLALKFARKALEVARTINNPRLINNALYHVSKSETLSGNPTTGLQLADQALALADELSYPAMQNYPHHARFQALYALGRQQEALIALKEAESRFRAGDGSLDANFYALELEYLQGNYQAARGYLEALRQAENLYYISVALRRYLQLEQSPMIPEVGTKPKIIALGTLKIGNEPVKGSKRKELIAILLEARISGRFEVKRLELLDLLYRNEDEHQASGALRKTIYQIRLSHGENSIMTTSNGYALGAFDSDVKEFLQTKNTQLWQGVYLEGIVLKTDDSLRETLHQALIEQAALLLEQNIDEVIRITRILLETDPYNLEATRLWLQALLKNKNHKTLNRIYQKTRVLMNEIGENLPEHWSDFLEQTAQTALP